MYSGLTITRLSGSILGAHQKIDRVARRHIEQLDPHCRFPDINAILHFEGVNGPDAIKRKSPSKDEPWHFLQPFDNKDTQLIDIINQHYKQLVTSLKKGDQIRAAFDSAWLAHAIVDGLTPAHHYPYEKELIKLRGEGIETRTTIKEKLFIGGETTFDTLAKNWHMWGTKGLMTTHGSFEIGVAMISAPRRFKRMATPSEEDLRIAQDKGILTLFKGVAKDIDSLHMYQNYYRLGWTKKLIREVRLELMPAIIKLVVIAWYLAILESSRAT